MLIDTHCHVNFKEFANDYRAIIDRAHAEDVRMFFVGTQKDTSRSAIQVAQEVGDWAVVGLHPIQSYSREITEEHAHFRSRDEQFDPEVYLDMAKQPRVVALGECGLDYYHIGAGEDREAIKLAQKKLLHAHIEVANEVQMPLVIHCRGSQSLPEDALRDLLELLKSHLPTRRGVIHSFPGDAAMAEDFIALGFYIGVNGISTFDKTGRSNGLIERVPLEKLLVETDAPYLTPVPLRGQKNEPAFVQHVARHIAAVKQVSYGEVAAQTTKNAEELFGIVTAR